MVICSQPDCPSQGKAMTLTDFEAHIFDCLKKEFPCPLNCGKSIYNMATAKEHWLVCEMALVVCPDCKEKIKQGDWVEHKRACNLKYESCPQCEDRILIETR